jgi:serine/threonine protein phosphatase PrpC
MRCILFLGAVAFIVATNSVKYSNVDDKIFAAAYNANDPIEDEILIYAVNITTKTYYASIFDGHGGNQASKFASQYLHQLIDYTINISESISKAYLDLDARYLKFVQSHKDKLSTTGSCGLTAVLSNNVLYVANVGDSIAGIKNK